MGGFSPGRYAAKGSICSYVWCIVNSSLSRSRLCLVAQPRSLWTDVPLPQKKISPFFLREGDVCTQANNRAPLQKGGALSDETKTAARETRSSLTRPQSSVFGSHTWPKGARGVMGRMKTKGRDDCLILTRKVALGHFSYLLFTENCVSYG